MSPLLRLGYSLDRSPISWSCLESASLIGEGEHHAIPLVSKTDKTAPLWVAEQRGECGRTFKGRCGYPCKHISMSSGLKVIKNKEISKERARVRNAIAKGMDEYENVPINQHRHQALWDLV